MLQFSNHDVGMGLVAGFLSARFQKFLTGFQAGQGAAQDVRKRAQKTDVPFIEDCLTDCVDLQHPPAAPINHDGYVEHRNEAVFP